MTNLTLEDLARTIARSDWPLEDEWDNFSDCERMEYERNARAVLDRIQETHRIVPIEPTDHMAGLGVKSVGGLVSIYGASSIYGAMINASPIIGEKG